MIAQFEAGRTWQVRFVFRREVGVTRKVDRNYRSREDEVKETGRPLSLVYNANTGSS